MIKFLLILIAVLLVTVLIFFFLWRAAKRKQKSQKETIGKLTRQVNEAIICQAKLESTIEIMKKNRSEADEKVNNLHNGNTTSNALNELRKRKS